jgi:hypothetical protein
VAGDLIMRSKIRVKPTNDQVNEHILRTLSEFEPMSALQYAEITGLKWKAAHNRLVKAWDEKLIHIARRDRRNGAHRPYYAIGSVPDAEPLEKITAAESTRKYKKTAKGIASEKRAQRVAAERYKAIRRSNTPAAENLREYGRNRERRIYGHQPRVFRNREALDEIAMQFGITWRFRKTRRMAA